MANKTRLPTDLNKRRKILDKRIAELEAVRPPTSLDGHSDRGTFNDTRILHKLSQVEKSNKRVVRSALAVAAFALVGIAYVKKDSLADIVQDDPSSIHVQSHIPLIDSQGNDVAGAVTYNISTDTQTRQLATGAGKALLVQVGIDTSTAYATTTLGQVSQVCMPSSPEAVRKGCAPITDQNACVSQTDSEVYCLPKGELSADGLFAKFVALKGTDNAWICPSEVAMIINAIKTNPDVFENSTFSKEEISSASTLHQTAYAPYTQVPVPALHNDIILVAGDVQLVC